MKYNQTLILLTVVLMGFHTVCEAQAKRGKRRPNSAAGTETTQWWIGFKAGTNFSSATPGDQYDFFSFVTEPQNYEGKQYEGFSRSGSQFGFIISFEFLPGLSANFMPAYCTYNYRYSNTYSWISTEEADKSLTKTYTINNQLQYVDLPLTFKYELTKTKLKPYIQAGGFYGIRTNAIKEADITAIDQASGGEQNLQVDVDKVSNNADDYFVKNNYGFLAGGGFTYNIGNARLGLEVNYRDRKSTRLNSSHYS